MDLLSSRQDTATRCVGDLEHQYLIGKDLIIGVEVSTKLICRLVAGPAYRGLLLDKISTGMVCHEAKSLEPLINHTLVSPFHGRSEQLGPTITDTVQNDR